MFLCVLAFVLQHLSWKVPCESVSVRLGIFDFRMNLLAELHTFTVDPARCTSAGNFDEQQVRRDWTWPRSWASGKYWLRAMKEFALVDSPVQAYVSTPGQWSPFGDGRLLDYVPAVVQWAEPRRDTVYASGETIHTVEWRYQCGSTEEGYEPCFEASPRGGLDDQHCTEGWSVAIFGPDAPIRPLYTIYETTGRYCVGQLNEGSQWRGERDQVERFGNLPFAIPGNWDGQYTIEIRQAGQTTPVGEPLTFIVAGPCSDSAPVDVNVAAMSHDFRASFDSMSFCPSLDREGFVCSAGFTVPFTPHRVWSLDTCVDCEIKRVHEITLWHTELRRNWQGMRVDIAGVTPGTTVTVNSAELCSDCVRDSTSDSTVGCAAHHVCATVGLLDNQEDMAWDRPLDLNFHLNFRNSDAFKDDVSTADMWILRITRKRMTDSSMLNISTSMGRFSPAFQPDGLSNVVRDLHLDLPRLLVDPSFSVDLRTTDVFASVAALYTPPSRDNGPMDTNRSALQLPCAPINPVDPTGYPDGMWRISGLSPESPPEYSAVPFGLSRLDIIVTNDRGDMSSRYRIHITKLRHTDARIRSLMPSVGVMTPAFDAAVREYSLLIHASDPTLGFRLLFTLEDAFANATASLFDSAANGTALSSFGQDLSIVPYRLCGYNQMVSTNLPYGSSTLALMVTADDGATNATSFEVTKVSFRLLSLAASEGAMQPAFDSHQSSYRISLANAQSSVTITAITPDHTAVLTFKFQAAGSRRGSVTLDNIGRALDPETGFTVYTIQLSDLPLGIASLSIRVRASDDTTAVYFVRIDRVLEPALAMQGFGQQWSSESDTTALPLDPAGTPSAGSSAPAAPSAAGVLSPSYDLSVSNYSMMMDPGVTRATFTFAVADTSVVVAARWFANPSPFTDGQAIMPLRVKSLYRLVVQGVSSRPGLLVIRIMDRNGVTLQRYDISIVQRVSSNCWIRSLWANNGELMPAQFRFDRYSYNLSLQLRTPGYPTNAPLRMLIVPQDAHAGVSAGYALPAHMSNGSSLPASSWPLDLSAFTLSSGLTSATASSPTSFALQLAVPDVAVPLDSDIIRGQEADADQLSPVLTFNLTAQDGSQCSYRIAVHRSLAREPTIEQIAYAAAVQLTLTFTLDLSVVDVSTVRSALELDLSVALDQPIVRFLARNVRSGSLLVDVIITPAEPSTVPQPSAADLVAALLRQMASMTGSPLSLGRVSQHLVGGSAAPEVVPGCLSADGQFLPADQCAPAVVPVDPVEEPPQPPSPPDTVASPAASSALPTFAIVLLVALCVGLASLVIVASFRIWRAIHSAAAPAKVVDSDGTASSKATGSSTLPLSIELMPVVPVAGNASAFDIESPQVINSAPLPSTPPSPWHFVIRSDVVSDAGAPASSSHVSAASSSATMAVRLASNLGPRTGRDAQHVSSVSLSALQIATALVCCSLLVASSPLQVAADFTEIAGILPAQSIFFFSVMHSAAAPPSAAALTLLRTNVEAGLQHASVTASKYENVWVCEQGILPNHRQGYKCTCTGGKKWDSVQNVWPAAPAVPVLGDDQLIMTSDGPDGDYKVCVQYERADDLQRMSNAALRNGAGWLNNDVAECRSNSRIQPYWGELVRDPVGCYWNGKQRIWPGLDPGAGDPLDATTPAKLMDRLHELHVTSDLTDLYRPDPVTEDHADLLTFQPGLKTRRTRTFSITKRAAPLPLKAAPINSISQCDARTHTCAHIRTHAH